MGMDDLPMSFRPIKLEMSGFRSVRKVTTLKFPKGHLFVQLSGRNVVDPHVGPNGVGKTTVLDALCWVLFGKTVRGIKGPKVRNWHNGDATFVHFWFRKRGKTYRIGRHAKPNRLTLQIGGKTRTIDQKKVHELLGFHYEAFCQTIVLGQFSQFFFDLQPAAKLQVFSDALDLGVWEKARNLAGDKLKEVADLQAKATAAAERAAGRIEELSQFDPVKAQAHLASVEAEVEALQKKVDEQAAGIRARKAKLTEVSRGLRLFDGRREDHEQRLVKLDKRLRKLEREEVRLRANVRSKMDRTADLKRRRAKVKAMRGGECPTCLTPLTAEHVGHARTVIGVELGGLKFGLKAERKSLAAVVKERDSAKGRLATVNRKLDQVEGRKAKLKDRQARLAGDVRDAEKDRDATIEKMQGMQWDTVELGHEIKRQAERKAKAEAERDRQLKELDALKVRQRRCEEWQEEFKSVRLWVVDTALDELKALTNAYIVDLGLKGWRVEFAVDREGTKKGSVIRGFSVHIYSPESPTESMPWEAYSGGEIQRLRIAGACAISSLLRARLNIDLPLELWDEPTAYLSGEGIDDLVQFFRERARQEMRQVWLIDHRSLNQGAFDRRFVAVKTKKGTVIRKAS